LLDEPQRQQVTEIKQIYEALGYAVIASEDVEATKELERFFPERLTVFMGQSGAGKSTVFNQCSPELQLATAEISQSLGRGKHTTRHVELIPLYDGLVADTPGFSAIDFLEMEAVELPKQFPEFVAAASHCKFRECMHHKEPGCEVKRQVEAGTIAT
ncbi:ribosome small subunit-dependent GTPase A, partial [Staphylococcus haemolyticus]